MSTVLDALAKADEEGGERRPGGPGLPPEPPRRRPRWLVVAGLFCLIVGGGFAFGLFSAPQRVEDAEVAAPETEAPASGASAVGALAKAEDPAARRRVEALEARRARAAAARDAKAPERKAVSPRSQPEAAAAEVVAGASGEAPDILVGGGSSSPSNASPANAAAAPAGSDGPPRVAAAEISPARQRRAERRALRLEGRAQRMAEREKLTEARELARDGKLTPQELRDLRRGWRDRTRAERGAERLARRVVRDSERNPEFAPAVPGAEPPEGETGVPPRGAARPEAGIAPEPVVAAQSPLAPAEPPIQQAAEIRRWAPSGQPKVAIQILQWSTNDARRFAYVSLDGGRATQVREGDQIGTLKVTRIYREVIEFGHDGGSFLLRAN